MKVSVIIPAAGLGTRMASAPAATGPKPRKAAPSKQFTELGGTPILIHTLRRFAKSTEINEIIVALRQAEIAPFRARLEKEAPEILAKRTVLLEGGESRQQSVANALAAVSAAVDDIVLVHDAVRPFVTEEMIHEVIAGATIPREKIVLAQTPQGFRYEVLKKAFDEATADGFVGTDEASLVERSGHEVAVVMGSPRNIKITTPADLELAEYYLTR